MFPSKRHNDKKIKIKFVGETGDIDGSEVEGIYRHIPNSTQFLFKLLDENKYGPFTRRKWIIIDT